MPVLSSETFGGCALIRNGVDGMLMPIADAAAMSRAILELSGDRNRLAEMGRASYARAADLLSPSRIAQETVGVYRAVLGLTTNRAD